MSQIGEIKVETESSGTVKIPIYPTGDSGSGVHEFLRVETENNGKGFIPLADKADAKYSYIRVQTKNNGVVAVHNDTFIGISELQNYIEDDWDDNNFKNRNNPNESIYTHPSSNEPGDVLIGRYRPEWNVDSGNVSATNKELQIEGANSGNGQVATISELTVGSWEFDFQYLSSTSGDSNDSTIWYFISNVDRTNSYRVDLSSGGNYVLNYSGSSIISSNWPNDTSQHTVKVNRSAYGSFELLLDGSSEGTNTHTTTDGPFKYSKIRNYDGNATIAIKNLVIK